MTTTADLSPDPSPTPPAQAGGPSTPPALLVVGDMLLDVVVAGNLAAEREAAGSVQLYAGGSAANFAVGAARAGAAVRMVGRVGDDVAGRLLVAELERAAVQAAIARSPGVPTGSVLVLANVDGQGGKRMISEAGASRTLVPADIDPAWCAGLAGLHLTGYSFLRAGPAPAARHALALVRAASPAALCSLDPAPAHLLRDYGPARVRTLLAELRFDLLLPNLEEGQVITGKTAPEAVARALRAWAPLVVVTLGAAGCLVAGDREPAGRVVHVPAVPGPVVDTTGAGDAFAAGFVVATLRGADPVAAAQAGAVAAAAVVGRPGPR